MLSESTSTTRFPSHALIRVTSQKRRLIGKYRELRHGNLVHQVNNTSILLCPDTAGNWKSTEWFTILKIHKVLTTQYFIRVSDRDYLRTTIQIAEPAPRYRTETVPGSSKRAGVTFGRCENTALPRPPVGFPKLFEKPLRISPSHGPDAVKYLLAAVCPWKTNRENFSTVSPPLDFISLRPGLPEVKVSTET